MFLSLLIELCDINFILSLLICFLVVVVVAAAAAAAAVLSLLLFAFCSFLFFVCCFFFFIRPFAPLFFLGVWFLLHFQFPKQIYFKVLGFRC